MYKKDTENYDIGKIDVYIRDKTASGFVFKQTTIMGAKAKSRFGTSLAKLGDINDDGFNGNNQVYNIITFLLFVC